MAGGRDNTRAVLRIDAFTILCGVIPREAGDPVTTALESGAPFATSVATGCPAFAGHDGPKLVRWQINQ
jgi:hypothetical protein